MSARRGPASLILLCSVPSWEHPMESMAKSFKVCSWDPWSVILPELQVRQVHSHGALVLHATSGGPVYLRGKLRKGR